MSSWMSAQNFLRVDKIRHPREGRQVAGSSTFENFADMETPFRIRRARRDDVDSVRLVHTAAIRSGAYRVYSPRVVETWVGAFNPDRYPENIQRMAFFVAELLDGRVSAFLALDLEKEELESIYVAPWAKGMGLGSYLLGYGEELARQAGIGRLWLDASLNAVSFYARYGWEEVRRHARVREGVEIPVVRMEKSLLG